MSLISCMLRMSSTFTQAKVYHEFVTMCILLQYETDSLYRYKVLLYTTNLVEIRLPKKVSALYLQDNF
jgi:hypothetical protein